MTSSAVPPLNTECFLAYAPRGVGLLAAVVYTVVDEDVYGWYIGAQGNEYYASYFMLEHFFSMHATAFYRTLENDVYGTWILAFPPVEQRLDRPVPVPENWCHALVQAQIGFSKHWLYYQDDPDAPDEIAACHEAELPVGAVNVRVKRLNKFDRGDVVWTYASAHCNLNVIDYLRDNWPLDFTSEDRTASTAES